MVEPSDVLRREIAQLRGLNGDLHRENQGLTNQIGKLTTELQEAKAREQRVRAIAESDESLQGREFRLLFEDVVVIQPPPKRRQPKRDTFKDWEDE